jgi:hypothetical protein
MLRHVTVTIAMIAMIAADGPSTAQTISGDTIGKVMDDLHHRANALVEQQDPLVDKMNKLGTNTAEYKQLQAKFDEIQRKVDALRSESTKIFENYISEANKKAETFNKDAKNLGEASSLLSSQKDFLENVAKYSTKQSLEKDKQKLADSWDKNYKNRLQAFGPQFEEKKNELFRILGSKNNDYTRRIGISNPYTGEAYYRYYDKEGKLLGAVWNGDADLWDRVRDDFDNYRQRMVRSKQAYEQEVTVFKKQQAGLLAMTKKLSTDNKRAQETLEAKMGPLSAPEGSNIIGTWTAKGYFTYTFYENGSMRVKPSTSAIGEGSWKWKEKGRSLTWTWSFTYARTLKQIGDAMITGDQLEITEETRGPGVESNSTRFTLKKQK